MKKIYFRADDAGSCESANLAIAQCLDFGLVHNVGVMAPGPAFAHAAELLAGRKDACFGLHVTLNAEWDTVKWGPVLSVADVPNLTDYKGKFLASPRLNAEQGLATDQAIAEVRAQLQKARDAGFHIQYLDEHMGVGWVGKLGEALARLMEEEGLVTGTPDLPHPKVPPMGSGRAEAFLSEIEQTPRDCFAVFHPGLDRLDMQAFVHEGLEPGQIARERQGDTDLLCEIPLKSGLEARGIVPSRFAE